MLLATQLAGSMCVDSVQVPSLVPSVQLSFTLAKLQLHLHNHLLYNGSGMWLPHSQQGAGTLYLDFIPGDSSWLTAVVLAKDGCNKTTAAENLINY